MKSYFFSKLNQVYYQSLRFYVTVISDRAGFYLKSIYCQRQTSVSAVTSSTDYIIFLCSATLASKGGITTRSLTKPQRKPSVCENLGSEVYPWFPWYSLPRSVDWMCRAIAWPPILPVQAQSKTFREKYNGISIDSKCVR